MRACVCVRVIIIILAHYIFLLFLHLFFLLSSIPGPKSKPPPPPPRPMSRFGESQAKASPGRGQQPVVISDPVLTGSTNRDSQVIAQPNRDSQLIAQPTRQASLSPKHDRVLPQQDSVRTVGKHTADQPAIPLYDWSVCSEAQQAEKPAALKKDKLGLPGQAAVNRTSFRGSEISSPIFVSTTNRNSEVFSNQAHDDSLRTRMWGSHSPPPVPPHGKDVTVRRTHSDRPAVSRPTSVPPQVKKGPAARKSPVNTSLRTQRPPPPPRPLPPDPRRLESDAETHTTYQNDPLSRSQPADKSKSQSSKISDSKEAGGDSLYLNVNSLKAAQCCNLASPEDDSFSSSNPPSSLHTVSSARSKFLQADSAVKGSSTKPDNGKSVKSTKTIPETSRSKVDRPKAQNASKSTVSASRAQPANRTGQSASKTDPSKSLESKLKKTPNSAKLGPSSVHSQSNQGSVTSGKSVSRPSESVAQTRNESKSGHGKVQGVKGFGVTDPSKVEERDSKPAADPTKVKPAGPRTGPGQVSRVAMLQSKLISDSSSARSGRPFVAPKPSAKVTRSFNV